MTEVHSAQQPPSKEEGGRGVGILNSARLAEAFLKICLYWVTIQG